MFHDPYDTNIIRIQRENSSQYLFCFFIHLKKSFIFPIYQINVFNNHQTLQHIIISFWKHWLWFISICQTGPTIACWSYCLSFSMNDVYILNRDMYSSQKWSSLWAFCVKLLLVISPSFHLIIVYTRDKIIAAVVKDVMPPCANLSLIQPYCLLT